MSTPRVRAIFLDFDDTLCLTSQFDGPAYQMAIDVAGARGRMAQFSTSALGALSQRPPPPPQVRALRAQAAESRPYGGHRMRACAHARLPTIRTRSRSR